MKQVYQHKVHTLNFKEGTVHTGCFSTLKDADEFVAEKQKEGCTETSISSGMGSSMYGKWTDFFNVEKYMGDVGEWYHG